MKASGDLTLEGFFGGRSGALALFHIVRKHIEEIGPVHVEVMKTQVSFATVRKFAWVWLPQNWIKKRPEDSITLTFALPYRIEDDRIEEAVEPRPGRWTHHIIIEKGADLDGKVHHWLKEAYSFSRASRCGTQKK